MALMKKSPLHERIFVTIDGSAFLDGTKEMTQSVTANGYLLVRFNAHKKQYAFYVHRLVAAAYCEGYARGLQVNHIDGNKQNNNASNLEWCTAKQNIVHAFKTGLNKNVGENNTGAKLTENCVASILMSVSNGEKQTSLAAKFNISTSAINSIVRGRKWRRISGVVINKENK